MNNLNDYSIASILPPSLKQDSFVIALAKAFEKEIKEAYREAEILCDLNNVDNLPEKLLDFLAYEKHVDFYENTLAIEQKRALLKNVTKWHRKKGTPAAVEELISTLFGSGEVKEWFQYNGTPYKFKVITSNPAVTLELADQFTRALESVQNKRSRLEQIIISLSGELSLYSAGIVHTGDNLTIRQVV